MSGAVHRLEPREPRRQLEQRRRQLPRGQPQQQRPAEHEQQPRVPRGSRGPSSREWTDVLHWTGRHPVPRGPFASGAKTRRPAGAGSSACGRANVPVGLYFQVDWRAGGGGRGSGKEVRGQNAEVRGSRTAGTAEQPEQPNSHLTQRARTKRKRRKRGKRGDCRCARWAHWFGGERNSRLERSEVRMQRSGGAEQPEQPTAARTGTDGHGQARTASVERRGVAGAERARRSLKHTGARPVDGAGGGLCGCGGAAVVFYWAGFGKVQVLWLCNYF